MPKKKPTKSELTNEIATIDKAIHQLIFFGGGLKLLINGDDVLRTRSASKGIAIYADLERDAHAGAVLDKRKRAVTAREWYVEPASEDAGDKEVADFVEKTLKNLRFDRITKDLLDATLKGFAVVEIMWGVVNNRLVPVKVIDRDQRRFIFDIDRNLRLLSQARPLEGEELPDRKFILHTVGGKDGTPYGLGVGQRIFWPVFFKRQNLSFWLIFNEKFGTPTAKGTYPRGATEQEQTKLLNALRAISQEAGIIIPEGMEVELLEAARTGSADGYERLCAYMDAQISIAVLGETLTTTVGNTGGNRALGEVHEEGRMELAKDDADELSATLNDTLIRWIVEYNFPSRPPPAVWRDFAQQEDLNTLAERDKKLSEIGFERTPESVLEIYGPGYVKIEREPPTANPNGHSSVATQPHQATAQFREPTRGFLSRLSAALAQVLGFAEGGIEDQRARNRDDQRTIAQASEQLAGEWAKFIGPRVKELQVLLDETQDLALFRERLTQLLDADPSVDFVETLTRATFASHLAGRLPR